MVIAYEETATNDTYGTHDPPSRFVHWRQGAKGTLCPSGEHYGRIPRQCICHARQRKGTKGILAHSPADEVRTPSCQGTEQGIYRLHHRQRDEGSCGITQKYFGKTTYLLLSKITALITIILNNITIFAKKT